MAHGTFSVFALACPRKFAEHACSVTCCSAALIFDISTDHSGFVGPCAQGVLSLLCSYYVIVAWIWSIIWYLGLDPIKWAMMYALNEDGWRNKAAHKEAKQVRARATWQAYARDT